MRLLFAPMFALLVLLASGAAYSVAVDDKPLANPAQEAVARALMKEIRCLVCQNQSIEDSNADLAKDLRAIVRERVALGDTPDNVRAYLVDRYGDWVLLEPPVNKTTWLLWASPFLFLAIVIFAILGNRSRANKAVPLSKEEQARLDELMKEDSA
jgi:cytochrome c-type biogenesis protein CcmH